MNKRLYWLKLKDDFFKTKEIKKLRKIAGGDTYTIIYLKMQLLSINNGGIIEFDGTEKNIAEQLSYQIDEKLEDIEMTLAFLLNHNLCEEIENNDCLLTEVPNLIGSESKSAARVRKLRNSRNNKLTNH